MNQPDQTVFTDTNCFIHLRDLKDLPWRFLFPAAQWVEVVVAPVVIEELDRFKVDRDSRRRDRSRRALNLIEDASGKPDFRLPLRDAPIKVGLRVASGPRPDWSAWPSLDPTRADDKLVAAALTERSQAPCALLSYDSGPLIRARMIGLPAHRSPPDWQLPEQPDETAQENARLKRELETVRATRSTINANFLLNGVASSKLSMRVPRLPPLPLETQKALRAELLAQHPKASLRQAGRPTGFIFVDLLDGGYMEHDIRDYNQKYRQFVEQTAIYFDTLHEAVARASTVMKLAYNVVNTSGVTATNLLLKFDGPNGAILIADQKAAESWGGSTSPPIPPKLPRTVQEQRLGGGGSVVPAPLWNSGPRDPTGFFWQDRPDNAAPTCSLICAEFRAMRTWNYVILIYPMLPLPFEGFVRLEVTATNLSATVEARAEIRLEDTPASWSDADVLARLEPWIAGHLTAS